MIKDLKSGNHNFRFLLSICEPSEPTVYPLVYMYHQLGNIAFYPLPPPPPNLMDRDQANRLAKKSFLL
jgi:hypothetical protein